MEDDGVMKKLSIRDCDVKGKRVLVRVDFNVPLDNDLSITDDTRILESLPTIKDVLDRGGRLILMSHLGRPKGGPDPEFSLKAAAEALSSLLGKPVQMAPDCVGPEVEALAKALKPGEVLMLENTRFHKGEEKNDLDLAKQMAGLGEVYVKMLPNGEERAFSPYVTVDGRKVRAISEANVHPQAYISAVQAQRACVGSGKRLCRSRADSRCAWIRCRYWNGRLRSGQGWDFWRSITA